jgi:hypothetical protein
MRRLVELLEAYEPGYQSALAGAPTWSLSLLAETVGADLPPFYQEFCLTMAEGGGALLEGLNHYHPEEIADLYDKAAWMPPSPDLFIFGDASPRQSHYFLDLGSPSLEDDAVVCRFPFGPQGAQSRQLHADSLRDMLYLRALEKVCLPSCLYRARFAEPPDADQSVDPPMAEVVSNLLVHLEFVRQPEATSFGLFLRSDLAVALVHPPGPGRPLTCQAATRNRHEMIRLKALLADYTSLAESRRPL